MSALSFNYVMKSAFFVILFAIILFPPLISRGNSFGKNASNGITGIPFRVMNLMGRFLYAVLTTVLLAIVIGMELDVLYFWKNPLG